MGGNPAFAPAKRNMTKGGEGGEEQSDALLV